MRENLFVYSDWPLFTRSCDLCGRDIRWCSCWIVSDHENDVTLCKCCAPTMDEAKQTYVDNKKKIEENFRCKS